MSHKTLSDIAEGLERGEFSSVEITQQYLDRIAAEDGRYNSYITVTAESALEQAKAADSARAKGEAGPLTGVPMAHKDIFCTQGVRTSAGSKMLDNFISPYNATVVEKLNAAGTVCLGKTNMDEFAMGSSNESSYYGASKNPWIWSEYPAALPAVQQRPLPQALAPIATGTDTGGSIRQPCAFTNLTGIKPTYGRVSRYGMIAFASSLDQGGPMAQNARDAALMLNAMSGFEPARLHLVSRACT